MAEPMNRPGMAVWRQIAEALATDIDSGAFAPGDRLPTEAELSARFRVNRHTVRRAIGDMSDNGLIRVERGRGTFVAESVVEYPVGDRPRFTEIMVSQQRRPGGRLLRALEIPSDGDVAGALALERGDPAIMIERLSEADGRPLSASTHYFSAQRFPDLIRHYEEENSITRALARCGLTDYLRVSTRVRARRASSDEIRILRLAPNAPILETESINTDPEGVPTEFGVSRFAAVRVELLFEN